MTDPQPFRTGPVDETPPAEPVVEPGAAPASAPSAAPPVDATAAPAPEADPASAPPPRTRRPAPRALLGALSLVFALATIVCVIVGVELANALHAIEAAVVAVLGVATSLAAVVLGVIALVRGRGRLLGIAGIVLGILVNPLVLTYGLAYLGGL